jgi:aminoglycoside phosphotransferase (APT) family kinase protein
VVKPAAQSAEIVTVDSFDPTKLGQRCEEYLARALGRPARLVSSHRLAASTRLAPWRLDVEVDGASQPFVLRLESRRIEHEFAVLRAMEAVPIPTPRVYGWDSTGAALGVRAFLADFIEGESLLPAMVAGEPWAEALYVDTVCDLQAVTRDQLSSIADRLGPGETAADFLETAYASFEIRSHPLVEAAYAQLKDTMPALPQVRFSNGDLWPDNLLVLDGKLAAIIDFTNAGFSDPLYEFLLPFFVRPELRGRGTEEEYCRRMGFDPKSLSWYRGLEYFDTWHWVMKTGKPFEQHTAASLPRALQEWLDTGQSRAVDRR